MGYRCEKQDTEIEPAIPNLDLTQLLYLVLTNWNSSKMATLFHAGTDRKISTNVENSSEQMTRIVNHAASITIASVHSPLPT